MNKSLITGETKRFENEGILQTASKLPKILFMKGISTTHSRWKRLSKLGCAIFNTANVALGSGVLGFSYGYRQSGWLLGLLITIASCLLLGYCMTIILRCARKYEEASYQKLVFQMYGNKSGIFLIWTILFMNFMCGTAYLLVINSQVYYFIGSNNHQFYSSYVFIMSAVSILCLPFAQLRSMDSLGSTSFIGITAVFFFVVVSILHAVYDPKADDAVMISLEPRAIQTIPIVFFSIFCHITIVPATSELLEYWPSKTNNGKIRFKTLVFVCVFVMALCFFFYGPAGIAGYLLFGTETKENLLDNLGQSFDINISRVCMIITTFASLPIITMLNRGAVFDLLGLPNEVKTMRMRDITLFNVMHLASTALIAIGLKYFNQGIGFVMSIVGATSGVAIQVGFPACFCWTMGNRIKAVLLMLLAVTLGLSGVFITIIFAICGDQTTGYCSFAK